MVTTDSLPSDPSYVPPMNRDEALEALPAPYGRALTLDAAGLDHAAIAEQIDLPLDAVATLLEVGHVKLATLLADETEATPQSSGCAASSARESTPSL